MQKGFVLMSVVGLALFAGTAVAGQEVSNDLSRCVAGEGPAVLVSVNGIKEASGRVRVQSYLATKDAWLAKGGKLQTGDHQMAVERVDRYRRPYEGTNNPVEAMQGYLDWEFGLVDQLSRDGTHHFKVI